MSSLGKYLPGKVWAVAGMALMAQRAGVAPWAATGSAVVLQVLAIGTGAAVAGLTGAARHRGGASRVASSRSCCWWSAPSPASALLLWPPVLRRLLRLAAPDAEARGAPPAGGHRVRHRRPTRSPGSATALALWCLARGLLPGAGSGPTLAIAVFTASYLAGFLALFAPGGLGVREGLFILMLQGPLGIGAATALALASRVLLTITEFGAAVPFLVFPQGRARVAP